MARKIRIKEGRNLRLKCLTITFLWLFPTFMPTVIKNKLNILV